MIDKLTILADNQPIETITSGAAMTTYTAAHFLNSEAFMAIAVGDAVKLVAKVNGQSHALTLKALALNVPNVVNEVTKLVNKSAEHCAQEANAGRLWA